MTTSTRRRIGPDERKHEILEAAFKVAGKPGGWLKLTRETVATAAKCSEGLISFHFGTVEEFKKTVMREAIRSERLPVIAQGIVSGDRIACRAKPELRNLALQSLCKNS